MGTKNIIDLDLSETRKKRIRIDGDDNRILEINTSDLNVISRLKEVYNTLTNLAIEGNQFFEVGEDAPIEEQFESYGKSLKEVDTKMRELVDYVFDAPVSEVCAPDGSMYDPFNGMFRFEFLFEKLLTLYESNFDAEFKKMSKRVQKHTDKYVKG